MGIYPFPTISNAEKDEFRRGTVNILVAYFSKTGNTEKLAVAIGDELTRRGHSVVYETIKPSIAYPWFIEVIRDFPRYPFIALSLLSARYRERYLRKYHQVEEDIEALRYPDISSFDRVCIGGPKWAQISYPVARYLRIIQRIRGKKVGIFTTFGGPPLKVFELELIYRPMTMRIERMEANVIARVAVSSAYHAAGIMPLFRFISRLHFSKPIESFTLKSEYARKGIMDFCEHIER